MSADGEQRQRAMRETDRSFMVEASAGTGKTRVLIERILHCVLVCGPDGGPLPITRICAITFTEKAAGEMKIRLRQEFERIAAAGGPAGNLAHQALLDLEGAAISTFHSFAVSLLKERPIEAGLDPRFAALDDVQSELLFREVWESWLRRAIDERKRPLETALRAGLTLSALGSVARTIRLHARDVRRLSLPRPPTDEETRQEMAELLDLGRKLRLLAREETDKLVPLLDMALAWVSDPLAGPNPAKPGNKGAAGNWKGRKDAVAEVRDFVRTTVEFAGLYRTLPARRALDGVVRMIIEELLPAWEERKRTSGLLDFDDQLWFALELLSSSRAAREEFQRRFAVFLVDEFQDTDPVQWDIIRLLATEWEASGADSGRPVAGRLFIVGDPKQSIYRFRGADIETYGRASDPAAMSAAGLERLELTTNFRSVPSILEFVDAAFDDVMKRSADGPYQPDYLAFGGSGHRPGRPGRACVHLLGDRLPDGKPAGSGPDCFSLEAVRIANLVASMAGNSTWEVQIGGDGAWQLPRYRDIAILLPVLTHADELEDALRGAGVPYVLEGGKFYYARSEVSSAITVLRSVANPNDAVAVYGALRSIFFGVSDEDLLQATLAGIELDYRIQAPPDSPLNRPFHILHELHLGRHERTASETMEHLLQSTGAREVLAPRGRQSLANLNKLVRTLRSLQEDAVFSEVVELVAGMDEEGMAESESRIMEEQSDAVRILSIHRSKGLDFPIVIVAGLGHRRLSRQGDFLADPHGDRIFALRAGAKVTGMLTPGWEELAELEKAREDAELLRLLYVALTRARDHLVLCTHTRGKILPDSGLWAPGYDGSRLKPLADFLSGLSDRTDLALNYLDAASLAGVPAPRPGGGEITERDWGRELTVQTGELRRLLAETPQVQGLGAGAAAVTVEDGGPEDRDSHPGRNRAVRTGIAFHEAMEEADLAGTPEPQALACAAGSRHALDKAGIADLTDMLQQTLNSPMLERVRRSLRTGGRIQRELPYVRPPHPDPTDFEEGKIDLLFEEDGAWVLVDYKTDRIPAAQELGPHFTRKYAGQLQAYLSALRELDLKVKAAYLLLARTGAHIELP